MSHPYKNFEPNWVKGEFPKDSYRSIFKWGAPLEIKAPRESLYKLMKEKFHLTDEDFQTYQEDIGFDKVSFDLPIHLTEQDLNAFQKKLFLYNPRNSYPMYDIIVDEKKLHITDSFYLPFRFGRIIVREYEEVNLKYREEEAILISNARLERYLNELIANDVLIIENNVKITFKDNNCIASGRIVVEEPAWKYRIIQENEWRIEPTDEHSGDNH
jgi:hypothetical protein